MVKKIDLDFTYEVKKIGQQKVVTKIIDQKEVLKVVEAIKEGQKIRDIEGPKLYGITCGF